MFLGRQKIEALLKRYPQWFQRFDGTGTPADVLDRWGLGIHLNQRPWGPLCHLLSILALVTNSFLLLVARHLFLVASLLLLVRHLCHLSLGPSHFWWCKARVHRCSLRLLGVEHVSPGGELRAVCRCSWNEKHGS